MRQQQVEQMVQYRIRQMRLEDYEEVYALWNTIRGFGIRSIDDSREGVGRFIRRNPTTSIVAELCDAGDNAGLRGTAGEADLREVAVDLGLRGTAGGADLREVAADSGLRGTAGEADLREVTADSGLRGTAGEADLREVTADSGLRGTAGRIIGSILCGHDGRSGCFYHVCVREGYRKQGIGRAMAVAAMKALQAEHINKVCLIAFKKNEAGNGFWKSVGWQMRQDLNYYDFSLNDENITRFHFPES